MKAIVRDRYGGPEVLELRDVPTPSPGPGEVLVRVRASSVNMADVDYVLGRPLVARIDTGMRRPKAPIPGIDMAGEIESVGRGATRFQPGDRVMADLFGVGSGAWAEYVAVPEGALTPIPEAVSFEAAGATPSAGVFALQGVRDKRPPQSGDRVLVNGASGNVGPFAVQIARSLGAEVTGVCRTDKMAAVREIGADHVIDHTAEDYRRSGERYDLIVDVAGRGGVIGLRRSIERGGGYVVIGANGRGYLEAILLAPFVGLATGRKMGLLMWRVNDTADMADLAEMLADGRVRPHIDSTFSLDEVPRALARVQAGDFVGKIAIAI
ncbi:MAG: NAD(P)-dependent alcohol dehydrogenase [Candidatus Limnocylindrales bacterium]